MRIHDNSKRQEPEVVTKGGHAGQSGSWPETAAHSDGLLTPLEAAQYLRLHDTGSHTPESAIRTLNYWRSRGELKATKFARRVWYLKSELDRFLEAKTEP